MGDSLREDIKKAMKPPQRSDFDRVTDILNKNAGKEFVKRIQNRENYPVLKNPDGSTSTHSMAWGESNGKYSVFPTVMIGKDKKLKRYSNKNAWDEAHKTGNVIQFDTPEEADWFSKTYKEVWRGDKK